jgi:hypothetical protein
VPPVHPDRPDARPSQQPDDCPQTFRRLSVAPILSSALQKLLVEFLERGLGSWRSRGDYEVEAPGMRPMLE